MATIKSSNGVQLHCEYAYLWLQVPEHTWGVDVKTDLADDVSWSNAAFHAALAKNQDDHYGVTVQSWQRQAGYLDWAVAALTPAMRDWASANAPEWLAPSLRSPQAALQRPQHDNPSWKSVLKDDGEDQALDLLIRHIIRLRPRCLCKAETVFWFYFHL